ncbi:MAG: C-GCAxxG-C-C family protein [Bacteroidota bacterium]|nr:C-GCAxxG-C-C family protein [Bacteroidota bacterium]
MKKVEDALSYFNEGFSCSQAVVSAYAEEFGIDKETALKLAGAFGGGMAQMGETCGAVTGALMVLGLKYGRINTKDFETKEKLYEAVKDFVEKFKLQNGTIVCRELLGYDISTQEGRDKATQQNLFKTICPKLVALSVEYLEEVVDR